MSSETGRGSWLTRVEVAKLGLDLAPPDVRPGASWGPDRQIRVAFAPDAADGLHGVFYAYDASTARFLILHPRTTWQAVTAAQLEINEQLHGPDGYRLLSDAVGRQPGFTASDARELWLNSVDADLAARSAYEQVGKDGPGRYGAAQSCHSTGVAREQAEQNFIAALRSSGTEPVVLAYQLVSDSGWTGRLPAAGLRSALRDVDQLNGLAERHGYRLLAPPEQSRHLRVDVPTRDHLGQPVEHLCLAPHRPEL